MRTLIVPCAGKSSRFPNMKPKYLLTYPDGSLMVQKSIEGLELGKYDRIVFTIIKEHDEQYEAELFLRQAFNIDSHSKYTVLTLEHFTSCQAETIYLTITKLNLSGEIVIKDSDNYVEYSINNNENFIVGINIEEFQKEINRLTAKSYLLVNEQGIINNIIEKKIKSQYICIGTYGFKDALQFKEAYEILSQESIDKREIYVSHIVAYLIGVNEATFHYIQATQYEDWGTLADWKLVQEAKKTYFIDLDGVIFQNRGKYGSENWGNSMIPLEQNLDIVKKMFEQGGQIVITTSRSEQYREKILHFFEDRNIKIHALVMDCHHSRRVIINDFAPTNPYPSCEAVNIPRNGDLSAYLEENL